MSGRDRIVAMVVVVLVVIGASWKLLVSPEREKASKLTAKVTAAQSEVNTAEGQLANARAAQSKYATAYAGIVNLGKAVPASQEVPSLIYQLETATNAKGVDFNSIVAGAGGSAGSSSSSSSTPAAAAAGFTQMPFTFIFEGGFSDLEHIFSAMSSFTNHNAAGELQVSGRLLTVQSVKLTPASSSSSTTTSGAVSHKAPGLSGTISASAYVLPATVGLAGEATAASPTGAAPASSTSSSAPTTPAIARVTP